MATKSKSGSVLKGLGGLADPIADPIVDPIVDPVAGPSGPDFDLPPVAGDGGSDDPAPAGDMSGGDDGDGFSADGDTGDGAGDRELTGEDDTDTETASSDGGADAADGDPADLSSSSEAGFSADAGDDARATSSGATEGAARAPEETVDGLGEDASAPAPFEAPEIPVTARPAAAASHGKDSATTETARPAAATKHAKATETAATTETTETVAAPKPSFFMSGERTLTHGDKSDEELSGGNGTDVIRGFKGDDEIDGAGGDDLLLGGHGDDVLDGGRGSDVVDAGKGDDTLIFDLTEKAGEHDFYDGGKGSDTLVIKMTAEQFAEHEDEISALRDWISENSDPKRSSGHAFADSSAHSAKFPVFETSFGLTVRNVENLSIEILDDPEPTVPEPTVPDPTEPDPTEPDPTEPAAEEPVVIDLAESGATEPESGITAALTRDGSLPLESVDVTLTHGSTLTLSIDVSVTELPSIFDVFLMQDLSGSFYNDLPNVQAQFGELFDSLAADSDVAFGVGSFIDKPVYPFGVPEETYTYTYSDGSVYSYTYEADYVYNTDLAITTDKAAIQATLDGLYTQSGYDWPEAQLEALVQTALRGEEIGYRDGAQKFVVLSTDAPFHEAGDYVGVAANDYDTEIEDEDYPEAAKVGELLKDAGITPIFAVTAAELDTYQALVDSWGVGAVTELSSDSSNLMSAITTGLMEASTDLVFNVSGDDYGFVTSITPSTYEDVSPGIYTFDVTLELPTDSAAYSSDTLTFEIAGYGEVTVNVAIDRVDATGDTGNDTLLGDGGANGLYGLGGDDVLDGRDGSDLLVGGSGNDHLTGGLGDDRFVFSDGDGQDVVADFAAGDGADVIDLSGVSAIADFDAVMAATSQVGDDTVIDLGEGNDITLIGVEATTLVENNFVM